MARLVPACLVLAAQLSAALSAGAQPRPRQPEPGAAQTVTTAHLTVQFAASETAVSPGDRVTLTLEVAPVRRMHVYAPGKHGYQVVTFRPEPQWWFRAQPLRYPPSEIYHFVPLDEHVETYQRPFTLTQDLTVPDTPEVRKRLDGERTLVLRGVLDYQACDDAVCYAPAKVPLSVALDLAVRQRPKFDARAAPAVRIGPDPRVTIAGQ